MSRPFVSTISSTVSAVAFAIPSIMAGPLSGAQQLFHQTYEWRGTATTLSTQSRLLSEQISSEELTFETIISGFYITLMENQERLGEDFENILHENLWDLYIE
jgi:hypothetical protein